MHDEFVRNAKHYGKKGEEWLENIPALIKKYEISWNIQVLSPYHLTYNYVAPVKQHDGSDAIIKIGMVWDEEFLHEIEALKVFNGEGATKLLNSNKEDGVILIEQIAPGTPLSTLEDDEEATQILGSTMKKLWKPLPTNTSFITIYGWTKNLREFPKGSGKYRMPQDLVEKA